MFFFLYLATYSDFEFENGARGRVLDSLRFRCAEVLFQPALIGAEALSIPEAVRFGEEEEQSAKSTSRGRK